MSQKSRLKKRLALEAHRAKKARREAEKAAEESLKDGRVVEENRLAEEVERMEIT